MRTPIIGAGLILREFEPCDVDAVVRIASTPGFNFYSLAPATAPQEEIKASAERLVKHAMDTQKPSVETGMRENFKLAVAEVMTPHRLIGYVALDEVNELRGEKRDVGYFIDPRYQGKGYAFAASHLVINRFFQSTPFDTIEATVHPNNDPSRRVLDRLGYKIVGEKTMMVKGVEEPRLVLTLHRDNFASATEASRPSLRAYANGLSQQNAG